MIIRKSIIYSSYTCDKCGKTSTCNTAALLYKRHKNKEQLKKEHDQICYGQFKKPKELKPPAGKRNDLKVRFDIDKKAYVMCYDVNPIIEGIL